jgi:hypothetical protein
MYTKIILEIYFLLSTIDKIGRDSIICLLRWRVVFFFFLFSFFSQHFNDLMGLAAHPTESIRLIPEKYRYLGKIWYWAQLTG